jgi:hypothetical protein
MFVETTIDNYKKMYDAKFKDKDLFFELNYWYLRLSLNITYLSETKPKLLSEQMLLVDELRKRVDDIQMQILGADEHLYASIATIL